MKIIFRTALSLMWVGFTPGVCSADVAKWQHVVDYFAAKDLLPRVLQVKSEVKEAPSGETIQSSDLQAELVLNKENTIIFSVLDGLVDGRAIDLKDMQELSHAVPEEELSSFFPFNQSVAESIVFTPSAHCQMVEKTMACQYTFTAEFEGKSFEGTAWLDTSHSLPVEVNWSIRSVPFDDEDGTINSLHHVDRYTITSDGACFPKSSETDLEMVYSFLFFKKKLHVWSQEHYSDYTARENLSGEH